MKKLLLAGAAAFTMFTVMPASAQVVGSLSNNAASNLLTLNSLGLSSGMTQVATLTGGTVFTSTQPNADDPQGYLGTFLAAGPTAGQPATLTFTQPTNFLSFLWGSPDTYNVLTINGTQTFTAASLGFSVVNGAQSFAQYVNFAGTNGSLINTVSFSNNPATDAFESANFSVTAPVPEPATWAMMLVGFGGIGFAMRRRKSKVTTNVAFA
jgi:hypothetical protein